MVLRSICGIYKLAQENFVIFFHNIFEGRLYITYRPKNHVIYDISYSDIHNNSIAFFY